MKVYYLLVSAFCVCITPTHSQFFYSHYTPLTQISPFFPQTFLPQLPAVSPLAYTVPQNQPISTSVTYNIPPPPSAEFRGFGYRTDFKDGASSTVFYVTGPEAENLRNFKDFPNLNAKILETPAGKARSLASDIIDSNAVTDAHEKIQSLLKPEEFDNIFKSITPGLVNFYTFPAGTVPLALARQLVNSTSNETVTTTTPSSEEPAVAESVVNSKVVINDVDNIIKNMETTSAAPATSSEESSNDVTTQPSDSVSVEAKETEEETSTEPSSDKEEATTIETTTQQ